MPHFNGRPPAVTLNEKSSMPVICVHLLSGRTAAQKSAFIHEVTALAVRTLDVPERAVTVVLNEASPDGWGVGGKTMTELRASSPGAPPL